MLNLNNYYITSSNKYHLVKRIGSLSINILSSYNKIEIETLYSEILSGHIKTELELFQTYAQYHKEESLIDYFKFLKNQQ